MAPKYSVMFCDDVRQEVNGKAILIGTYTGDLVPSSLPASFPISYVVRVQGLTGRHKFALRLKMPGNQNEIEMGGEVVVPDGAGAFPLIFGGIPLQLNEYGPITLSISIDDEQPIEIASLGVVPPQNPPSPTSNQSSH